MAYDQDILIPVEEGRAMNQEHALFVCIHNAGRSQMAAALFERSAGDRYQARSAGSAPAEVVNPVVVEAMREIGIDISDRVPRKLDVRDVPWAHVIITMGCGDACPFMPGKQYEDWDLVDPSGLGLDDVRPIRDEIARRIEILVAQMDARRNVGQMK
jgi:arsenate reductase